MSTETVIYCTSLFSVKVLMASAFLNLCNLCSERSSGEFYWIHFYCNHASAAEMLRAVPLSSTLEFSAFLCAWTMALMGLGVLVQPKSSNSGQVGKIYNWLNKQCPSHYFAYDFFQLQKNTNILFF